MDDPRYYEPEISSDESLSDASSLKKSGTGILSAHLINHHHHHELSSGNDEVSHFAVEFSDNSDDDDDDNNVDVLKDHYNTDTPKIIDVEYLVGNSRHFITNNDLSQEMRYLDACGTQDSNSNIKNMIFRQKKSRVDGISQNDISESQHTAPSLQSTQQSYYKPLPGIISSQNMDDCNLRDKNDMFVQHDPTMSSSQPLSFDDHIRVKKPMRSRFSKQLQPSSQSTNKLSLQPSTQKSLDSLLSLDLTPSKHLTKTSSDSRYSHSSDHETIPSNKNTKSRKKKSKMNGSRTTGKIVHPELMTSLNTDMESLSMSEDDNTHNIPSRQIREGDNHFVRPGIRDSKLLKKKLNTSYARDADDELVAQCIRDHPKNHHDDMTLLKRTDHVSKKRPRTIVQESFILGRINDNTGKIIDVEHVDMTESLSNVLALDYIKTKLNLVHPSVEYYRRYFRVAVYHRNKQMIVVYRINIDFVSQPITKQFRREIIDLFDRTRVMDVYMSWPPMQHLCSAGDVDSKYKHTTINFELHTKQSWHHQQMKRRDNNINKRVHSANIKVNDSIIKKVINMIDHPQGATLDRLIMEKETSKHSKTTQGNVSSKTTCNKKRKRRRYNYLPFKVSESSMLLDQYDLREEQLLDYDYIASDTSSKIKCFHYREHPLYVFTNNQGYFVYRLQKIHSHQKVTSSEQFLKQSFLYDEQDNDSVY